MIRSLKIKISLLKITDLTSKYGDLGTPEICGTD